MNPEKQQIFNPLDPISRNIINQDLFVVKSVSGGVATGTVNGIEQTIGNVSSSGRRYFQAVIFAFATNVVVGDGRFYIHVPSEMNGSALVEVHAEVITAGTTGTTDIQIHNVNGAVDMLSTKLTIDSAETGSDTAATPAVINTSNDNVATNDVLRIDVDAVSTTPPKGLLVTLGFE